jgi:hypothetical protein
MAPLRLNVPARVRFKLIPRVCRLASWRQSRSPGIDSIASLRMTKGRPIYCLQQLLPGRDLLLSPCHPEGTLISDSSAFPMRPYAAFFKGNRTRYPNAARLHRKSGEAMDSNPGLPDCREDASHSQLALQAKPHGDKDGTLLSGWNSLRRRSGLYR